MSVWEYKVITSGKGGFATPALLESFLNQLGKEQWEIIHFQTQPDNPLAFTGLGRRSTQRDWTLEDAAAAAARAEAEKLRSEFESKFREAVRPAEDKPSTPAEKDAADDSFRKLRDTASDLDPDAADDEGEKNDWDQLDSENELPTFFEALRPHLRRNQRGAGLSAGIDYLAKKWQLSEEDIVAALKECGLAVPEDEDTPPAYVEYDGDLYWVNVNRRGELWINTREKPRPVFRTVAAQPVAGRDDPPKAEGAPAAEAATDAQPEPLPAGPELLEKLLPLMRRDRRGPGVSGSVSFLSRALKCGEAALIEAFAALGLTPPAPGEEKSATIESAERSWWLNRDQRGGVWINGRKTADEGAPAAEGSPASAPSDNGQAAEAYGAPAEAPSNPALAAVRLLLKESRGGGFAGEVGRLAADLGQEREAFLATLTAAGLKIPEKPREKPVFVPQAREIFWLNLNAKDELWLNAKASKYPKSDGGGGGRRGPRRGRRGPSSKGESEPSE